MDSKVRQGWRAALARNFDHVIVQVLYGKLLNSTVPFTMPPLPKNVDLDPHGVSAWNMLLAAEEAALKIDTRSAKYMDELVGVRVVGFFLLDFYKHSNRFGLIAYKRLLREVISCFRVSVSDNEAIYKAIFDLGLSYRNHLIRVCEYLTLIFSIATFSH